MSKRIRLGVDNGNNSFCYGPVGVKEPGVLRSPGGYGERCLGYSSNVGPLSLSYLLVVLEPLRRLSSGPMGSF